MLRASIRSVLEKYRNHIGLINDSDFSKENISFLISESKLDKLRSINKKYIIRKGFKILDNPNHHKMMRKELTMNIFPFGNNGTDPSLIVKLVRLKKILIFIIND